ncbi:ABC transporter permease [soil metagenome]
MAAPIIALGAGNVSMNTSPASADGSPVIGGWRAQDFLRRLILSEYLVLLLTLVYFLVMWAIVPEIATTDTLLDILSAMMPLLVVAIGQTFVLIVAGIDLAAPSVIAMASVVGASVMTGDAGYASGTGLEIPLGILAFLAVGGFIGTFNGLCTTRFNMPSFIVTLTTMMFFSGAAIWYTTTQTDASSIGNLPVYFVAIGQGQIGGVPYSLSVVLAVAAIAYFILTKTVYGRWLYAVGLNPRAAAVSGVPVRRVVFWAFVISGVCAAIASILYTGRLETGTPVLGQRILLDVIGAAVIGGVSLFGGKGKIMWTVFGVLFLTVIDKSLQLMGLSLASVFSIKGLIILLAAVIDALRHRFLVRG